MKTQKIVIQLFITLLVLLTATQLEAQDIYRVNVENLQSNPNRYLNNVIIIEGVVDRHLGDNTAAGFFYLRDDFGSFVRVRVLDNKPEVNKRISLRGVYTREIPLNAPADFLQRYFIDSRNIQLLDPPNDSDEIVITPEYSLIIDSEPEGAEVIINGRVVGITPYRDVVEQGTYSVTISKSLYEAQNLELRVQNSDVRRTVELERGTTFYALIAGAGVLLLLVILGIYLVFNRDEKKEMRTRSAAPGKRGGSPAPPVVNNDDTIKMNTPAPTFNKPSSQPAFENKTVKINAPKDHTIKVLDKYFEVVDGLSEVSKLHLYQNPDQQKSEYTFGRNSGTEYYHIQLKSPAVSRQQAKLIVTNDGFVLINYAKESSNPTRVNDREMQVNESVNLSIGDVITMGDVKLKFSSKRS